MRVFLNPKWKYIARDECGDWYIYEELPIFDSPDWKTSSGDIELLDPNLFTLPSIEVGIKSLLYIKPTGVLTRIK